jgi:transcription elongation GreA/GreB family factor
MTERYLTKEGLNQLKTELDTLKTVKRRELAEVLKKNSNGLKKKYLRLKL